MIKEVRVFENSSHCGIWKVAIGLQDVDGLKPSEYLIETEISIAEADKRTHSYYEERESRNEIEVQFKVPK